MPEAFVLRYPLPGVTADEAEWVGVDASGARTDPPGRGTLAAAAAAVAGRRVVVLVPGEDVSLAAPELPGRGAARLARLAPFALEEQLAADVDTLHFAVGRPAAGQRAPVAVLGRAQLAGWLATLAAAGITPAALYPDSLALPQNPSQVVLAIDGRRLLVRRPLALPLVLDAEPIDVALAIAGLAPDVALATTHLVVYATAADWEAQRGAFEPLRASLEGLHVQLLADGALGLFAASAARAPELDLLQGEFAQRQGFAAEWPRWRLAASLFGAFLVLHFATLSLEYWRVHRDEVKVDLELRAALSEALPNARDPSRLPSPRAAVESRLRKTRSAVSEGLLGTLGVLAAATTAAPGTRIDSLNFHQGTTDLTVDAPDVGALDRMQQSARARGYTAQLLGATQHDARYQGRLQLKGPG
jgi:general secretion pathway protein L